jgi:hypothetical protein
MIKLWFSISFPWFSIGFLFASDGIPLRRDAAVGPPHCWCPCRGCPRPGFIGDFDGDLVGLNGIIIHFRWI